MCILKPDISPKFCAKVQSRQHIYAHYRRCSDPGVECRSQPKIPVDISGICTQIGSPGGGGGSEGTPDTGSLDIFRVETLLRSCAFRAETLLRSCASCKIIVHDFVIKTSVAVFVLCGFWSAD